MSLDSASCVARQFHPPTPFDTLSGEVFINPPETPFCIAASNSIASSKICPYPGLFVEAVALIFQAANIQLDLQLKNVLPATPDFGAMFTRVINNESNIVLLRTSFTAKRALLGKYTSTIQAIHDRVFALAAAPKPRSASELDVFQFLSPFDPLLWVLVFILFLSFKLFKFISRCYKVQSLKLVVIALAFVLSIFAGLYQGFTLSMLLVRNTPKGFQNLDELTNLIESGKVKLITQKGVFFLQPMVNQSNSITRFHKALEKHPPLFSSEFRGKPEIISMIQRGKAVKLATDPDDITFDTQSNCGLRILMLSEFFYSPIALFLSKSVKNETVVRLNEAIHKTQSLIASMVTRYEQMLRRKTIVCPTYDMVNPSLNWQQVKGIFVLLAIGAGLGVFALVGEKSFSQILGLK